MKKVVYFNQWFSSIRDVIADLKLKYSNDIEIIASSKNPNHVYKDVVDTFIVETWEEVSGDTETSMNNYYKFVCNIIETYHVDIFFVKKYADFISSKRAEISKYGVFVVTEPIETTKKLLSKAQVYHDLSNYSKELDKYIPAYIKAEDCSEAETKEVINFLRNYKSKNIAETWCLKKDTDEGGASFRKITRSKPKFSNLNGFRTNEMMIDEVMDMVLTETDCIDKLIFMELLDSPEISVDCYNSKKGFIAVCRSKGQDRTQRMFYDETIVSICREIQNYYKFLFPFNVQFRYESGTDKTSDDLRLLEINPRMSGGTYYGVPFGLNIAEICLLDILNKQERYDVSVFQNFSEKLITHVEKPVIIKS